MKPTVQKEAAGGNAVIESVLWDAVPSYLRKVSSVMLMLQILGPYPFSWELCQMVLQWE